MAKLRNVVSELVDLVEHLVGTHVHWNIDLSKDEAVAKLAAARVELAAHDAEAVAHDVQTGDVQSLEKDVIKAVSDAEKGENPSV